MLRQVSDLWEGVWAATARAVDGTAETGSENRV